jgi:hypothetical protein
LKGVLSVYSNSENAIGFVVSHSSGQNKDAARVVDPQFVVSE